MENMELKINEYQIPAEISGNFDELKAEIAERVSYYKDLAYTDSQMKEAKADRAKLRKLVTAIDDQRKRVKSDLLAPYVALETKLDEIKALIQEPIDMIDAQVKEYESLQKQTKTESIRQTFINKGYPWMADVMWNPRWLNTTYSMKAITEEIDAQILKYETDLKMLETMENYSFEAIEEYKRTLDYGKAMLKAHELKEQAKRKAEYEETKEQATVSHETIDFRKEFDPLHEDTPRFWVKFMACVSVQEAEELKRFFEQNRIEYKAIMEGVQ